MSNLETSTDEQAVLVQQHNTLKELLEKSNDENNRYKQRLDRLTSVIQERERRIADLQVYETRLKKQGEKSQEAESQQSHWQKTYKKTEEEKANITQVLADSQQHAKQLERVILFLRERAETSHLEMQQTRGELEAANKIIQQHIQKNEAYTAEQDTLRFSLQESLSKRQELLEELDAIKKQWAQLLQAVRNGQQATTALAALNQEKQALENSLMEKSEEVTALREERMAWESKYQTETTVSIQYAGSIANLSTENQSLQQRLQATIAQKDKSISDSREEIAKLQLAVSNLESLLITAKSQNDEKDAAIRTAQHHLGKKVKEAAVLNERNETLQNEIAGYKRELDTQQVKANEWQTTLENLSDQVQSINRQLEESAKANEVLNSQWESRYHQLQDRLQEAEARNRELKALEDKHAQLQSLITNFNALTLNTPTPAQAPTQAPVVEVSKPPFTDHTQKSRETPSDQGKIFDQKQSIRYKQSLFD